MKQNKLFEAAGSLLTETEDDTIYGARVAQDAAEDDAFIAYDESNANNIDEYIATIKDKFKEYVDVRGELWELVKNPNFKELPWSEAYDILLGLDLDQNRADKDLDKYYGE